MKSNKILVILSSLVILMMCLSVVSAAVNNVVNDDITTLGDSKIPTHFQSETWFDIQMWVMDNENNYIPNAIINCELSKDGKVIDTRTLVVDEYDGAMYPTDNLAPGDYVLTCNYAGDSKYGACNDTIPFPILIPTKLYTEVEPFGDKVISSQLFDKDANPLANKPICFRFYDAKDNFISSKTIMSNDMGVAEYDTSKLAPGKYKINVIFEGDDTYDPSDNSFNLTVDGKQPIPPKNETKDPKDVDMENTGAPIIALVLGLLVVAGIGYRKY